MLEFTAWELRERLAAGAVTAVAVASHFLNEIRQLDQTLGAFLHVDDAAVLAQAEAVDARRRGGDRLGSLAGVPVAVKDVLCVADQPTTCGSKMLQNFRPPYDAHVITRLKEADAVLI